MMNKTDRVVAERLARYGFGKGQGLGVGNRKTDDLTEALAAAAKGDDGAAATDALRLSVERYQRLYADDIEPIARELYGRKLIVDGEPGPATIQHLMNRRCETPDFANDGTLVEEARWPDSCKNELTIFIDFSSFDESAMGISRAAAIQVYEAAILEWNLVCDFKLQLVQSRAEARISVDWARLGGSTLAWSHLANNDCGSKQQRYTIRRWTLHLLKLTILHELGHLIGLPHESGNFIMNPSIIESLTGLTARDRQRALALGYGPSKLDPNKPDPNKPDPTDPRTGTFKIEGVLKNGTQFVSGDVSALRCVLTSSNGLRTVWEYMP